MIPSVRRFSLLSLLLPIALIALAARIHAATPHNVLLARGRTEPVVAIDPTNPSTIVAGSNTNYQVHPGDTFPVAYFTSHDAGRSFRFGNMPVLRPYTTGADPSLAIARGGTVIYSYLGETPSYCSGGRSAILISISNDHGQSFAVPHMVDADPADDKPSLAVESVWHGYNHVFVTWTRWHNSSSDIWYSRSVDGGATFSAPIMLYSSTRDNFGSVPLVGPNGHIYVFWSTFPDSTLRKGMPVQVLMRASTDDGRHFSLARSVGGSFRSLPRMMQPGSLRDFPSPSVAVGKHGNLFVAWAAATALHANGSSDADIEISRSADRGRTWSRPVRVNSVRHGDRFMPSVSVLSDGSVGVAFYDRRNSPYTLDLYAVRVSTGRTMIPGPNARVNARSSPVSDIYYIAPGSTCFSPGRFFGDYIGSAAGSNGSLNVVWADTQLHVQDETDLWFAQVQLPVPPRTRHRTPTASGLPFTRVNREAIRTMRLHYG